LQQWLTNLANVISDAAPDDEDANRVIRHLEQWSDQIYETEKELLLIAIEKKSHFAFDIIHWISQVTEILLAVSNAEACDQHSQGELKKNALWLISVLSWIPDDKASIAFVENFQLNEVLFEAGVDAHRCQCEEVVSRVCELLIGWTFKAGKYQNGRGSFEQGLYALAALCLEREHDGGQLMAALTVRLGQPGIPNDEIRARTARRLREKAATLYRLSRSLRSVTFSMENADHELLRPILGNIADLISPETVGEEVIVHHGF
jgi:hypothetical protein